MNEKMRVEREELDIAYNKIRLVVDEIVKPLVIEEGGKEVDNKGLKYRYIQLQNGYCRAIDTILDLSAYISELQVKLDNLREDKGVEGVSEQRRVDFVTDLKVQISHISVDSVALHEEIKVLQREREEALSVIKSESPAAELLEAKETIRLVKAQLLNAEGT